MNPNNQKNNRPTSRQTAPSANRQGQPRSGRQGNRAPAKSRSLITSTGRNVSRGAALRAQKRTVADANRVASQYSDAASNGAAAQPRANRRANVLTTGPELRIIGLGGMDGGGSKNMIVIEYGNDAIVIDGGSDLGVDLPGINYGIADTTYLDQIASKIKGFVLTHGHLDHIGGLPHILPKYPGVPVFGSRFTIGRVEEIFENFGLPMPDGFELKTVIMNETTHERLKVGSFFVELVRVTHSIPGSTAVVVDTPVGRLVNTGDFRFDPNPLDHEKTDMERFAQLAKEGVLVLMSESTTTDRLGRTPSESTIEQSFIDIMDNAPGRIFVGLFSTNMNRVQMIINAAVHHGKKVTMDGRSMVSTLEMAVRNGFVKIPKGTFVPIASAVKMKDEQVVVVCTGSQGEPNSALVRMSMGDHKYVQLKEQDTVILSSSPIPYTGNDALIRAMTDDLLRKGVHVYRHESHEVDNIGPLHVSGHASRDEFREMITMMKPKLFIPIYGDFTAKKYHLDIAIEAGMQREACLNAENGDVITVMGNKMAVTGQVPHGTILVDQTGAVVSSIVVKDRVLLAEEGLVSVILTIDKKTGSLLTSPDIISRGFIYMKDNEELMNALRAELRRAVTQRFKRVDLDRFKAELKDYVTHFLFEQTQRSPIVIPVVNIIGGRPERQGTVTTSNGQAVAEKSPEELALEQQRRFAQMRQRLLNQDARVD